MTESQTIEYKESSLDFKIGDMSPEMSLKKCHQKSNRELLTVAQ
jgi:hypothetical protein